MSLSPLWLTQVLFKYAPYFYVSVEEGLEREVESVLRRKFAEEIADVVQKDMWDLDMPNHLAGHKRTEIQLKFRNCQVASILVFPPIAAWWPCRPHFKEKAREPCPTAVTAVVTAGFLCMLARARARAHRCEN